jgi:Cu+-exporting ATPase
MASHGTHAEHEESRLAVQGMHCAGCAATIDRALRAVPGVQEVRVDLQGGAATVRGDAAPEALAAAVRRAGYDATPAGARRSVAEERSELEHRQHAAATGWRNRFIVAAAVWAPWEALHWLSRIERLSFLDLHHAAWGPWLIAAIVTGVVAFTGGAFYRSAWRAARRGTTNMDTLIALGATASYVLSVVDLLVGLEAVPSYFAETAGLLALISLGHWLEARTTAAAGSAVRGLLALQPDETVRLRAPSDAEGERIATKDVREGDLVRVLPGERLAVDGRIVAGRTTLDESVVTGEAMPAERAAGDAVVAGTLNLTGRLAVRATSNGWDTTVSRIAEMVREAQTSKANIQRLADYVSSIFVPAVLAVALLTVAGWGLYGLATGHGWELLPRAIINATTVLIISCPCALGLATPTAVMVASGAASRRGILIKSARAIERIADVDVVLFDKTGTLTIGRPRVVDASDEALRIGAGLAAGSSHPLSRAIVEAARLRGLALPEVSDVQEVAGAGLEGRLAATDGEDARRALLLSVKEARARGLAFTHGDDAAGAASVVALVRDGGGKNGNNGAQAGEVVGVIAFRDEPREEARALVEWLHRRGVRVGMLTGDRAAAAAHLAGQVGLDQDEVRAELSPTEKVAAVREAKRGGRIVAMVGDGVNDAAALAEAGAGGEGDANARGGVGVAIGTGTNIAVDAADVVIPGDRIDSIKDLLHIGGLALRTIKQNLFMSFVYNSIAIPAAAFGLLGVYGPVFAAGAMAVSDVCVVGNSLRLKWRLSRRQRPAGTRETETRA